MAYMSDPNTIPDEASWLDDDVQADVLFPQFKPGQDDKVDLAAFNELVEETTRKGSIGNVTLNRTLSKEAQLYGEVKKTSQQLLTEEGREVLQQVLKSTGWWVDALCPTDDEMRVIAKTFHIHALTVEDILAQEPREKVELFPNYTFVCFRTFDMDVYTEHIRPYNFYILIFKEGLLTFHFQKSPHPDKVHRRMVQLRNHMTLTPDWMNYALIDAVTDSFAPLIFQVEMEAVSIDELSMVLRRSEQGDMLKRIGRCRRRSTQLSRLLSSKLDVLKSLMKRYEDKNRDISTRSFSDVLLYLGDIQDHIVTMLQNVNHYDRILYRAHTNYLAQVNLELSQTYSMTNKVMNRLTFLATVFIPLTLISGLWGMNVMVPGKDFQDLNYFYWLLGGMAIYCVAMTYFGKTVALL
ncbi:CorA metal ion transporter [Apophysomyces ossiformis]|uniref:CorA metal ion transporter n=1 Tax=Apophysomyces ossiformis TaxID=679940 RepID=A0A8H7BWY4_9FUNG|nr:CorA metal ion transporter [Apophysomyces ossiformis]